MGHAAYPHVFNAEIESADIRFERGFILSAWVFLKWDGAGQGFGGFALGGSPFDTDSKAARHGDQRNIAADFIGGVMAVAGVEAWSQLAGKIVRVGVDEEYGSPIRALGHPTKERWYEPAKRFAELPSFEVPA